MNSDRTLVSEAGAGSREAFDELVHRYRRPVHNLVRALSVDDRDAEDLVQDIFVRAYRAIGSFRGESTFRSWLYRIALNVVYTHRDRRRSKDQSHAVLADGREALEAIAGPEDVEETYARRRAIDRALAALPDEWRLLVVLRDVQGLSYEEIAKIVKTPRGTVDSRLFRARQRLRLLLEAYGSGRAPDAAAIGCACGGLDED